jgi:hypothetical protein
MRLMTAGHSKYAPVETQRGPQVLKGRNSNLPGFLRLTTRMFRKERARTYSWGKDVVQSMDKKKCIRCFEVHGSHISGSQETVREQPREQQLQQLWSSGIRIKGG